MQYMTNYFCRYNLYCSTACDKESNYSINEGIKVTQLSIFARSSSALALPPDFCDDGTTVETCTDEKPDNVPLTPSTDVNHSEEIITMLGDPAAADRVLLDLLGPADTRIMQAYADGGLKQNLAHHALASCLHFAMWLRESGDISRSVMKPLLVSQSWRKERERFWKPLPNRRH